VIALQNPKIQNPTQPQMRDAPSPKPEVEAKVKSTKPSQTTKGSRKRRGKEAELHATVIHSEG